MVHKNKYYQMHKIRNFVDLISVMIVKYLSNNMIWMSILKCMHKSSENDNCENVRILITTKIIMKYIWLFYSISILKSYNLIL